MGLGQVAGSYVLLRCAEPEFFKVAFKDLKPLESAAGGDILNPWVV